MSDDYDPFNSEEREELDAARKDRARLEAINEGGDLKWLMQNKRGRRVMWRLLASTRLYQSSFNNSGSVMAFNEGQRNVGLKLLAALNTHCPELYVLMQTERQNDAADHGR
jgi:hypothetical protein